MRGALVVALVVAAVLLHQVEAYRLTSNFSGSSFFDNFDFYNGPDPTHGYVYYTSREQAFEWGLVNTGPNGTFIGVDSWSISSGSGRAAVRIESRQSFESGLFIASINHMPQGCGTWPAYWMYGPDWPNNGEIDIIEGVNLQDFDQSTLHTSEGCDMRHVPATAFTGQWASLNSIGKPATDCNVNSRLQNLNAGCGIATSQGTFGEPFNQQGGGFFATQWNSTLIRMWFWPFGQAPKDIDTGAPMPDRWGTPYAFFALDESSCPASHFRAQRLVINTCLCGDWAGSVWEYSPCYESSGKVSCNDYVQNNPKAFQDAYWSINYITIYH